MNDMHIHRMQGYIKYRNDDNFVHYNSTLVKNDKKGAKYSNNPNGHESTKISDTHT